VLRCIYKHGKEQQQGGSTKIPSLVSLNRTTSPNRSSDLEFES
jgi:hypothetical protein